MKANLLYIDEDTASQDIIFGEKELIRDLKLDILIDAMADQDPYLRDLCKDLLLQPSINKQDILLRQEILKEALNNNDFFVSMYRISVEDKEKTLSFNEFILPKYDRVISVKKR
ncbi:MAG: hypothetical protein Q8858_17640, partial [Bacteroidota bacterium]|nr:hypothetical protein [Bacteroidota bacterium]